MDEQEESLEQQGPNPEQSKAVSYSNNNYSSGRKASDDYNFGKGDSD